jgi:hypothetical protein
VKPGDLVKISGIIGEDDPLGFAVILRVEDVGPDGPSMDSYATVVIDGKPRVVWLYQCEVIGERSDY